MVKEMRVPSSSSSSSRTVLVAGPSTHMKPAANVPTVTGLILTPSST